MPTPREIGEQAWAEIECERRAVLRKCGITYRKLAQELKLLAFSDLADHVIVEEGGGICALPLSEMGKKSRAVKRVKEHRVIREAADGKSTILDDRVEYELHDKLGSIRTLLEMGNWTGTKKIEHSGTINHSLARLSDDELMRRIEALERDLGRGGA